MVNSGKPAKDPTHQLMAHHLCRIQGPLDLRKRTRLVSNKDKLRKHTRTLTVGNAPMCTLATEVIKH
jgi:hypothetical protein